MSSSVLLQVHVILSLIGIGSGFVVVFGLLGSRTLPGWTALFLATTVLTCLTGFPLPHDHLLPSDIVGIVSLIVLAIAIVARYVGRLQGSWRWIYAVGAVLALYLNTFVGVVQAFQKIPALHRLAPTQAEPPFAIAQVAVLLLFLLLGVLTVRRFRSAAAALA